MFKKVLIANRSEIAVRIIRACKEMGLATVAVHSDVDRDCLHVKLADESVCIGPAPSLESYLNIPAIISAAEITGADAVHPGYGFLAENTHFAEICESCGIAFIGPSKEAIKKMGDKAEARKIMRNYGVPVIPGSEGCVDANNLMKLSKVVKKIGFPLIVKAKAGGGGRGMRIVEKDSALREAITAAQNEAKSAFGNGDVYLERYLKNPRHVEVQVLADMHKNVISFPERDCSVQRRHQKLIEESPSPVVDAKLRHKICKAARKAARAVRYYSAGTVEFLLDSKNNFYFMEMNTRIQVEHPVTELITGVDLIKEQIRIAANEELSIKEREVPFKGHAIECRINSEDPYKGFLASAGKINSLVLPGGPGVRVDTHIYAGYEVPPFYDSLIAKLIVVGDEGRKSAITRMLRALDEFMVDGVHTTVPFHKEALRHEVFHRGEVRTDFVDKHLNNGSKK